MMLDKQSITEDYKLVESTNNMWIEKGIPLQYLLETRTTSLAEALKKQQQILDGLKALEELPTLTESREYWKDLCNTNIKQKYTLYEENQKLKERLKKKEELLDWTINYGEYVIYGLRSEIEELTDRLNQAIGDSQWMTSVLSATKAI